MMTKHGNDKKNKTARTNGNKRRTAKGKLEFIRYSDNPFIGALKAIHVQNEDELATMPHSHDYYELAVVVYGDGFHQYNGKSFPLYRGQAYLIPPGKTHYYSDFSKIVLQNFMFSAKAMKLLGKSLKTLPAWDRFLDSAADGLICNVSSSVIAELDLLLNSIAMEKFQFKENKSIMLFSYLVQLLGIISNCCEEPFRKKFSSGDIEQAVLFMNENYRNDIQLPMLAKISYMSVSTFTRRFNQEFGMPPMKYLLKLRLHHAKIMLMRSECTIYEVAAECGFRDPLYFTRRFRMQMGCTPSKYRLFGHGRIQITEGEKQLNDDSFLDVN